MTMASCQIAVVETGTLVNGSMAWVKVGILFSQKVQFCPPTPAPPHPPSTDPKIPLLQSLGDQVANKCSHWHQVDSALREAFSQRLQSGCVAGWVHKDVHLTWRLLFWLLQSLCKWVGWVILYKHILSQVGPEVDQVLRHYVKQGSATILPWQLPLKSQVKVSTPCLKKFSLRYICSFTFFVCDQSPFVVALK